MLDKSLPYYNLPMQRKAGKTIPTFELPEGYSFVPFTRGAEHDWAEIEVSVGEFDYVMEALEYFRKEYLLYPDEVYRRTFFIQTNELEKIATFTSWWNYTGERRDPSLNWIGVKPEFQGLGLGKAIIFEGLRRRLQIEGDRDLYLHTQTWSYKAIGIYQQAGFEFMRNSSFGGYENDFAKAVPYLKDKLKIEL